MLDDLAQEQLIVDRTTFKFTRLTAIPAFDVLEKIRHEVGMTVDFPGLLEAAEVPEGLSEEEQGNYMQAQGVLTLLEQVMRLRPQFVKELRGTMFRMVFFTNDNTSGQTLAGSEDMAFEGMEVNIIYKVLIQSLVVNFRPFFLELLQILNLRQKVPDMSQ